MNKYAAEKIASEYYNMGIQLALQNAGLVKTANPLAKALGIGGGVTAAGLSPAALTALTTGRMGGQTGANQLAALKSLFGGEFAHAADVAKTIPGAVGRDFDRVGLSAMEGGERLLQRLADKLPSSGIGDYSAYKDLAMKAI